jgi:hypothetical protein
VRGETEKQMSGAGAGAPPARRVSQVDWTAESDDEDDESSIVADDSPEIPATNLGGGALGMVFIRPKEQAMLIARRSHDIDRGAEPLIELSSLDRAVLSSLEIAERELYADNRSAPFPYNIVRGTGANAVVCSLKNAHFLD